MMNSIEIENPLVVEHMDFARNIARRLSLQVSRTVAFEDILSFAQLGLIESAERWKPNRGTAFTTFAWYRIRGAVFDGLHAMSDSKCRVTLSGDSWAEPTAAEVDQGAMEILETALHALSPEESEVVEFLYVKGLSTTEVATKLGVHKSTISRMHHSVLDKLRLEMMRPKGANRRRRRTRLSA